MYLYEIPDDAQFVSDGVGRRPIHPRQVEDCIGVAGCGLRDFMDRRLHLDAEGQESLTPYEPFHCGF